MTDTGISNVPTPTRTRPRLQPGLRLQIVLALAGLMLLAFVPLFFAVASLTRATVLDARERAARVFGRALAVHLAGAQAEGGPPGVARPLAGVEQSGDVV